MPMSVPAKHTTRLGGWRKIAPLTMLAVSSSIWARRGSHRPRSGLSIDGTAPGSDDNESCYQKGGNTELGHIIPSDT